MGTRDHVAAEDQTLIFTLLNFTSHLQWEAGIDGSRIGAPCQLSAGVTDAAVGPAMRAAIAETFFGDHWSSFRFGQMNH
jgi:hypothetical protein